MGMKTGPELCSCCCVSRDTQAVVFSGPLQIFPMTSAPPCLRFFPVHVNFSDNLYIKFSLLERSCILFPTICKSLTHAYAIQLITAIGNFSNITGSLSVPCCPLVLAHHPFEPIILRYSLTPCPHEINAGLWIN